MYHEQAVGQLTVLWACFLYGAMAWTGTGFLSCRSTSSRCLVITATSTSSQWWMPTLPTTSLLCWSTGESSPENFFFKGTLVKRYVFWAINRRKVVVKHQKNRLPLELHACCGLGICCNVCGRCWMRSAPPLISNPSWTALQSWTTSPSVSFSPDCCVQGGHDLVSIWPFNEVTWLSNGDLENSEISSHNAEILHCLELLCWPHSQSWLFDSIEYWPIDFSLC